MLAPPATTRQTAPPAAAPEAPCGGSTPPELRAAGSVGAVDWCVDARNEGAIDALFSEIEGHLARRALAGEDDPMDVVRTAVRTVLQEAPALWVRLTWAEPEPELDIRPLLGAALPGEPLCAGLTAAHAHAAAHEELTGTPLRQHLPAWRAAEDHGLATRPWPWAGRADEWAAATTALLARAAARGRSVPEAAADAGAAGALVALGSVARAAAGTDRQQPERPAGPNAEQQTRGGGAGEALTVAVEAFRAFHAAAGGDPWLVELGDGRAVVANRRCPFGTAAVDGVPELCRSTSALLGTVAASLSGQQAEVVVDESFALGDRQCRLVVDLAADGREQPRDHPVSHRYRPANPEPGAGAGERSMRLSFALRLPSDGADLHAARVRVRAQLRALDVVGEDCDDVTLALTEACSNVIDHAGSSGEYDVVVDLAGNTCEVRVVDPGRGLRGPIAIRRPASDAERGRGIALMHALMDEVRVVSVPGRGTTVRLLKRVRFETAADAGAAQDVEGTQPSPTPPVADPPTGHGLTAAGDQPGPLSPSPATPLQAPELAPAADADLDVAAEADPGPIG
jgi:serine/threonine-protein kinase RsbW